MPAWTEVLGDRAIGGEEPLCMPWRLKPLHAPLALPGGLVGVLCAIIQIPMLAFGASGLSTTCHFYDTSLRHSVLHMSWRMLRCLG